MRNRIVILALALFSVVVPSAAAQPMESAQRFELPRGVEIDLDGAGGAQVSWRGETVARIDLLLLGGPASDPTSWSPHALSVAGGAELTSRKLLSMDLGEGQRGGRAHHDDDGDGRVDEDPYDGLDNDDDGLEDEDYAAIGHQMRVSLADLEGVGFPGARLRSTFSVWPYFHVDDVLFWQTQLEAGGPILAGAPGARISSPHPLFIADEVIEPHVSLGRAQAQKARFPYVRADGNDGRRLYLAVVRLDGRGADILPTNDGIIWEAGSDTEWPIALIVAPTLDVLYFSVGQALLTRSTAVEGDVRWSVPPLCARCQQVDGATATVRIDHDDGELRLDIDLEGLDEHLQTSPEGTTVAGLPLASYLMAASRTRAEYRLPLESLDAQHLIQSAAAGRPPLEIVLWTGESLTPAVTVEMEPSLRTRINSAAPDFPTHLAPRLLQTWPNPFQQTTNIRFDVPATLGDAFEFEPGDERVQRLDLQAAPPFGSNPLVRVRVYNVSGQLIRFLDEDFRNAGRHSISWDGTDEQGMPVAAGAYYVNVEIGEFRVTRRVLRLKP